MMIASMERAILKQGSMNTGAGGNRRGNRIFRKSYGKA